MYHNKIPKPDVIDILETNFEEGEMLDALKMLHDSVGLEPPQGRQTSVNRTAVQAYAVDIFECLAKLVSENKLPTIVVASSELSRVPMNKKRMDNTDVATVNCRLETLEAMMKNVVNAVNKINDKPSFNGTVPKVVVGNAAPAHGAVGGVAEGAAAGLQGGRGQGQGHRDHSRERGFRDRSPAVKRSYNEVVRGNYSYDGPRDDFQEPRGRRQPRKMAFGTNKVDIDGAEAAPIEVFVGNTNPRATEDIIKKVLLKCAENMPDKPELEILDVEILTNPERDPYPRFKSWRVKVPYKWKSLMENDSFSFFIRILDWCFISLCVYLKLG